MSTPTAFALGLAALFAACLAPVPRLGRLDYDPDEIAGDGPFTAQRKWLHVQKVLIGITVYAVLITATFVLEDGGIRWLDYDRLPFLIGVAIVTASALREVFAPTDPQPHTAAQHTTDWVTDWALYSGGAVLELIARGAYFVAALSLAGYVVSYRICRNGARP